MLSVQIFYNVYLVIRTLNPCSYFEKNIHNCRVKLVIVFAIATEYIVLLYLLNNTDFLVMPAKFIFIDRKYSQEIIEFISFTCRYNIVICFYTTLFILFLYLCFNEEIFCFTSPALLGISFIGTACVSVINNTNWHECIYFYV